MNITLPDDLQFKIQNAVKDTNRNVEDFVREAIETQLQEEERLRLQIQQGIDSGPPEVWNPQDIKKRGQQRFEIN